MPARAPRKTRPSHHVKLYKGDRWIRIARRVAHIPKKDGWSETPPDEDTEASRQEEPEHPVHVGGGMFELSDGNRVKGKTAAVAAQATLDQQGDE